MEKNLLDLKNIRNALYTITVAAWILTATMPRKTEKVSIGYIQSFVYLSSHMRLPITITDNLSSLFSFAVHVQWRDKMLVVNGKMCANKTESNTKIILYMAIFRVYFSLKLLRVKDWGAFTTIFLRVLENSDLHCLTAIQVMCIKGKIKD